MEPSVGDFVLQHHRLHTRPPLSPPCKNGVPARPDPASGMAQYHLSAHAVITQAKGQKVVRSAAYAAGERLQDDRYGEVQISPAGATILYNAMVPPENAPDWAHDRQQFWNAVEHKEKRKDSQLAIPYDIALPYELTLEQNIALIPEYAKSRIRRPGPGR